MSENATKIRNILKEHGRLTKDARVARRARRPLPGRHDLARERQRHARARGRVRRRVPRSHAQAQRVREHRGDHARAIDELTAGGDDRGRVRGVTGTVRTQLVARLAARGRKPAGDLDALPDGLDSLRWIAATAPGTAASALRAAGAWSCDDRARLRRRGLVVARAAGRRRRRGGARDSTASRRCGTLGSTASSSAAATACGGARERRRRRGGKELVIRCRALAPELAKKRPRPRWNVPMLEQQQLRWFRTTLLGRTPGWSPPCPPSGRGGRCGSRSAAACAPARSRSTRSSSATTGFVRGRRAARRRATPRRSWSRAGRARRRASVALTARATGAWTRHARRSMRPARWWPHTHGEPARYAVAIEVDAGDAVHGRSRRTSASARSRSTATTATSRARQRRAVFCRGACWTPLDAVALSAPRGGLRRRGRAGSPRAGMNMLRVGGTMIYEDDAFYDALDERGVLLWQDLMFANMDYPDDARVRARSSRARSREQLARLQARPCVAVVCGNSEVEQQAAMWRRAARALERRALFDEALAQRCALRAARRAVLRRRARTAARSRTRRTPGRRRTTASARTCARSTTRAAPRCGSPPSASRSRTSPTRSGACRACTRPAWKARAPRDLGAGWDFDDVRDHYVQLLFGVDPVALRYSRPRPLPRARPRRRPARSWRARSREWRRARSRAGGALIWFLRDLWPGAGWGVVDARGAPKAALVRAAPRARAGRARVHRRGRQRPRAPRRQRSRRRRSPAASS